MKKYMQLDLGYIQFNIFTFWVTNFSFCLKVRANFASIVGQKKVVKQILFDVQFIWMCIKFSKLVTI